MVSPFKNREEEFMEKNLILMVAFYNLSVGIFLECLLHLSLLEFAILGQNV